MIAKESKTKTIEKTEKLEVAHVFGELLHFCCSIVDFTSFQHKIE